MKRTLEHGYMILNIFKLDDFPWNTPGFDSFHANYPKEHDSVHVVCRCVRVNFPPTPGGKQAPNIQCLPASPPGWSFMVSSWHAPPQVVPLLVSSYEYVIV